MRAERSKADRFQKSMLFAGSGGQGMMTAGRLLAEGLMEAGYNVTYFPSYGAEVRGGTAHCHVRAGEGEIPSPIVEEADLLVVMNEPSYARFSPLTHAGSQLVLNTSLIPEESIGPHNGRRLLPLNLSRIADSMGSLRSANMLVLGLVAGLLGVVPQDSLARLVTDLLGAKNPALLQTNLQILAKGYALAAEAQ